VVQIKAIEKDGLPSLARASSLARQELRLDLPPPRVQTEFRKTTESVPRERDFFIDNLLVRIHLIVEMILVDRPCAMVV